MIRVSYEPGLSGQTNMARDRMLFPRGGARVYTWDGPWVTLGAFQTASAALLPTCPVRWSPRPTGGRAVLHGHDVTLGLCLPLSAPLSVRRVYPVVVGLVVAALRGCGADAHLGRAFVREGKPSSRSADCFGAVSPNDIVDSLGRKVCGCALKLSESAVLVQASIPVHEPLVDPAQIYEHPAPVHTLDLDAVAFAESLECELNTHQGMPDSLS